MRFRSVAGAASCILPLALALLVAGCSGDSLKNFAANNGGGNKTADPNAPQTDVDCPGIQVRSGASTWQDPSGAGTTELRYQASLGQMARECALTGNTMTVKIGVEGRLLVGPKGQTGAVTVPLRLALVEEGPNPKSIWTKFYPLEVSVPPGSGGTPFTEVEDRLTFEMPPDKNIAAYVIYVGFDPQGLSKVRRPVAHKSAPKPHVAKKKAAPRPAAAKSAPPATSGTFGQPASGSFGPPAGGTFAPPPSGNAGGGGFAPPPGQFSPPAGQQ